MKGVAKIVQMLKVAQSWAMHQSEADILPALGYLCTKMALCNDFFGGDADMSFTCPVKCSSLRKGGYAMLQGFPCKIMELSKAQPGKHGHAKMHLIGLDVFTGRKHEDICPTKENIEVPVLKRTDYQLINVDGDFLELMDQAGRLRDDVRRLSLEKQLEKEISQLWGKNQDVIITLLEGMGQVKVISAKANI